MPYQKQYKVLLPLLFILGLFSFSKANIVLTVHGEIKEEITHKRLKEVIIYIKKDGVFHSSIHTKNSSNYKVLLPADAIFEIEFSKQNYVSKRIVFSTKDMPKNAKKAGFDYLAEITLFKQIEGLNNSILNQPLAKIFYNKRSRKMQIDQEYQEYITEKLVAFDKTKTKLLHQIKKQNQAKNTSLNKEAEKKVIKEPKPSTTSQNTTAKNNPSQKITSAKLAGSTNKKNLPAANKPRKRTTVNTSARRKPKEPTLDLTKYPLGFTEETLEKDKMMITRRIIVTEEQTDVYEKIVHHWGGIFYQKNGQNITKALWDLKSKKK